MIPMRLLRTLLSQVGSNEAGQTRILLRLDYAANHTEVTLTQKGRDASNASII